jgi:hypothetical protein
MISSNLMVASMCCCLFASKHRGKWLAPLDIITDSGFDPNPVMFQLPGFTDCGFNPNPVTLGSPVSTESSNAPELNLGGLLILDWIQIQ